MLTGTVFYFAVESEDELSLWMDRITSATLKQDFSKSGQEAEGKLLFSHSLCSFPRTVVHSDVTSQTASVKSDLFECECQSVEIFQE